MSLYVKTINYVVIFLSVATLTTTKPIMISFGTNKGPIVPRSTFSRIPITVRSDTHIKPAPVYEIREDIPNPETYKPLIPFQYRKKIFAVKPRIILETPPDVKYTPNNEKYDLYKKAQLKVSGETYVGPNLFERQAYEFSDFESKKTFLQPFMSYVKLNPSAVKSNSVPEIGIIYSSGVRFYVPQILYQLDTENPQSQEDSEQEMQNSVYDKHDKKYVYRTS